MKAIYKHGGMYIVQISDTLYYIGDGKDHYDIYKTPDVWLKFMPYAEYVGDEDVNIPEIVRSQIQNAVLSRNKDIII